MRTKYAPRTLWESEGGAIMVMGIFMGTGLVGMLWYLAGIGDAIQYRERLQEATDAVAFSSAVLHARGMNLIVLLNLIMACILAIRVLLKLIAAILVIVGTILAAIPIIGWIGGVLLYAAKTVNDIEMNTRNAIDQTIKALSQVQVGVKWVVPPATIAGAAHVGDRYAPVVNQSYAGGWYTLRDGLPVEEGSTDKLCYEAGLVAAEVVTPLVPFNALPVGRSRARNKFKSYVARLVEKGGAYFCALDNSSPPDLTEELEGAAGSACTEEYNDLKDQRDEKRGIYMAACNQYNAPCRPGRGPYTPLTEEEQTDLDAKQADYAQAQARVDSFNRDRCKDRNMEEMRDDLEEASEAAEVSSGSSQMTPKMVTSGWRNGINQAQVLAVSIGDTSRLSIAPRGLRVGAWNEEPISVPTSASFAVAQAEFFYDCSGSWGSDSCNGPNDADGNAMWNFAWRARLRRYNSPFETNLVNLDALLVGAEWISQAIDGVDASSIDWNNAELVGELGEAAAGADFIIH